MRNHSRQDLFRYLRGDLSEPEKKRVEGHLKTCGKCNEFLAFVGNFNTTLKEMAEAELQSETACPNPGSLVAFQAGELDEKTARLVRQHTVFCKDCLEELYLLRQAEESRPIKADTSVARTSPTEWRRFVEKLQDSVVDLGRKYGLNTLIGPYRILSEVPRFGQHMRGAYFKKPQIASKSIQVEVGKNLYAITVATSEHADRIMCEVSTLRQSAKRPLDISVHSASGEELNTARTNEDGFSHFAVSGRSLPDELLLLTLNLEHAEQHVLFHVPLEKLSAISKLSYTERTIVELVAQGFGTEAISKKISVSQQAVKEHLSSIFHTLGISDVAALEHYAADFGPFNRKGE
jgi:DNA-binding CsgD family transcriptional regulator